MRMRMETHRRLFMRKHREDNTRNVTYILAAVTAAVTALGHDHDHDYEHGELGGC